MLVIDPKVYSLIKVSETGSYTRAAEQLSLTQPAVSQHIRALEGELGIRIFERVNNELRITHEGETAIKYAKRMLSLYNNLQRDLTSEKRQLTIDRGHHSYGREQRYFRGAGQVCKQPRGRDGQDHHRYAEQPVRQGEKL